MFFGFVVCFRIYNLHCFHFTASQVLKAKQLNNHKIIYFSRHMWSDGQIIKRQTKLFTTVTTTPCWCCSGIKKETYSAEVTNNYSLHCQGLVTCRAKISPEIFLKNHRMLLTAPALSTWVDFCFFLMYLPIT